MDDALYRLIYVSHIAPLRARDLEAMMRDILVVSHWLNRRDGITGLLLSNGVWFAQALEGEAEAVEACYARIAADQRHLLPTVRLRGEASWPLFDRWSMCGQTLSPLDDLLLKTPQTPFDIWSAEPDAILQLLKSVADRFAPALDIMHAELGADVSRWAD